MPSRWVRIVGVRGIGLGPTWEIVVRRVPLGVGPACLGKLCTILSIVRVWLESCTVLSVRLPLAVVSGEGESIVATPALVSG